MNAAHTSKHGYTDAEIAETIAIQDALDANAIDFAALIKLRGMTADMPGYPEFAKQFARNCIRDEQLRIEALAASK